ncbi:hypothetical protein [Paludisphaera borealis]|uniref:Uncharacterized protein n=1 Tax=Paludisphaera borealis TaxID=1387353 RepID=A0A1U7CTM4_9BACT|nr:hypothetical protein [Paludisphaera borealis]APW62223.1 hypothetical protein BSF38_03758 [Paludisphaera borealis]
MRTNSAADGRSLPTLALGVFCALAAASCDGRQTASETAVVGAKAPDPPLDPNIVRSGAAVQDLDDPRLAYLREASIRWRRFQGPERMVVDQVCLVPDVPTFLATVAGWDERHFFPILIDDPQWTLPFLRAFRPARIVRCQPTSPTANRSPGNAAYDRWQDALTAVSRGWVHEAPGDAKLPPAGAFPRQAGLTPPGAVLSHPESPMLAAAVALAAGRFQPLLRVEPMTVEGGLRNAQNGPKTLGFTDAPTEDQAVEFARKVQSRIVPLAASHERLGDDLDFLTLAGDWPYRYRVDSGPDSVRGERAVDDLIGRVLAPGPYDSDKALLRWAYTGRILGDPPASVYRAMCSLFLQPETALFWDTYGGGRPWEEYEMTSAATTFGVIRPERGAVVARSGDGSDLASWHHVFQPVDRFGLLMINSSGEPKRFAIRRGPGRPSDVPFGGPAVVSMIHSFSAALPDDPSTIAGRFLDHGAYIYFGSMYEPYLPAFRTPRLLAQLIVAQVPLGAALREGPYERFGLPWRLVYLGDPLFRVHPSPSLYRPVRMSPEHWSEIGAGQSAPPVAIIGREEDREDRPATDAGPAETLDWCLDAALLSFRGPSHDESPTASPPSFAPAVVDLREFLVAIDRDRLDPGRRSILDELMIDQSTTAGASWPLLQWLLRIAPQDRSSRVWRAIETTVMNRFADFTRVDDFANALDFWTDQILRPWPPGSEFPSHFTERFGAVADPPRRLEPYRRRLADALSRLTARDPSSAQISLLAAELKRVEEASKR